MKTLPFFSYHTVRFNSPRPDNQKTTEVTSVSPITMSRNRRNVVAVTFDVRKNTRKHHHLIGDTKDALTVHLPEAKIRFPKGVAVSKCSTIFFFSKKPHFELNL